MRCYKMASNNNMLSIDDLYNWCFDEDINYRYYKLNNGNKCLAIQCEAIKHGATRIVYRIFLADKNGLCKETTKILDEDRYALYNKKHCEEIYLSNVYGTAAPFKVLSSTVEKLLGVDIIRYKSLIKYLDKNNVNYTIIQNHITSEITIILRADRNSVKAIRYRVVGKNGNTIFSDVVKVNTGIKIDDIRNSDISNGYVSIKTYNLGSKRTAFKLLYI